MKQAETSGTKQNFKSYISDGDDGSRPAGNGDASSCKLSSMFIKTNRIKSAKKKNALPR